MNVPVVLFWGVVIVGAAAVGLCVRRARRRAAAYRKFAVLRAMTEEDQRRYYDLDIQLPYAIEDNAANDLAQMPMTNKTKH